MKTMYLLVGGNYQDMWICERYECDTPDEAVERAEQLSLELEINIEVFNLVFTVELAEAQDAQ